MAPHRRVPWHVAAASFAFLALVAAACSSSSGSPPPPEVHGILGFDDRAARAAFVPPISKEAFFPCGSNTTAFGTELLNTAPNKAKVLNEWGDLVPGEQVYEEGSVTGLNITGPGQAPGFFSGDLPPTHPFGRDITYNMQLDSSYARLSLKLGPGLGGNAPGFLHTEIPVGRLPHDSTGNVLSGFMPQEGDRSAVYGHWIVDCGHDSFQSEVHPPSFMSFGHQDGSTTVVHAFADPYYETQLFNPDPSVAADVTNTARFSDPATVPFPLALYNNVLQIAGIKTPPANRLAAHMLIAPNETSPITWYACAPSGTSGKLSVNYHFNVRPGVRITEQTLNDIGCAQFTATIGSSYAPQTLKPESCVVPWSVLNAEAAAALGEASIDIRGAIVKQVPASIAPKVENNPVVDCYPSLVAPALTEGNGTAVASNASQPFPFYGEIEVSRG
ncbi:MAG: hypothetical protein M3Q23_08355 [Actinomycetota bacterium]|nr:hypothetical protein [Actinomycetota bacterium]